MKAGRSSAPTLARRIEAWRKVPAKDRRTVIHNVDCEADSYAERYSGPADESDARAFRSAAALLRAAAAKGRRKP